MPADAPANIDATVACPSCDEPVPAEGLLELPPGEELLCADCLAEGEEGTAGALARLVVVALATVALAWFDRLGGLFLFGLMTAVWSQFSVFPHELGHLLAARAFGWRVLRVNLGRGRVRFGFRLFGASWRFRSLGPGGSCECVPQRAEGFGWQRWGVYTAGPAVHLLMLSPLLFASVRGDLWAWNLAGYLWAGFLAGNLLDLVYNLLPIDDHDGKVVWSCPFLSRDRQREEFATQVEAYALCLTDEGETEIARQILLDLLATDGLSDASAATAQAQLAWCELMEAAPGYFERAHAHVAAGAAALHAHPRIHALVGCLEVEKGMDASGKRLLQEVLEEEEDRRDRARCLFYLALASHRLGKKRKARTARKWARSLDAHSPIRARIEAAIATPVE